MTAPLDVATARRAYFVVLALRWLPTGFLIPITVLLMTSRGLSLTEAGLAFGTQGVVVALLELPTGGLADALGRRPVLILSSLTAAAALVVLYVAHDLPAFMAAFALMGVYRALDSGPLEAWYVDAALAVEPGRDLERDLSGAGVVLGLAVGVGALGGGALGLLAPADGGTGPLELVLLGALAAGGVHLAAVLALIREVRPARGLAAARAAVVATPATVASGVRLATRQPAVRLLLAVEVLWGFGLSGVEMLWQPRTADLLGGGATDDTLLFGAVAAGAWVASAAGAALVPPLVRLMGGSTTRAAALLRVLQGATVLGMAAATGVPVLAAAFILAYVVHGASNPPHFALLHREIDADRRATILSANSLVGQGSGTLGGIALGSLADAAGIPGAWVLTAFALAAAAPLYLLAGSRRREPAAAAP